MGTTVQNRRGTSAARLLGLLAVLLGLLAMHGLASTHHATAAVPVPPPASHAGAPTHDTDGHAPYAQSTGGPTETAGVAPAAGAAVAPSATPGPACGGDCPDDVAMLCLAVLVAAFAVAVLAAAARRHASPTRRPAPSPVPATALLRPPLAPDPVKDLCVSRT